MSKDCHLYYSLSSSLISREGEVILPLRMFDRLPFNTLEANKSHPKGCDLFTFTIMAKIILHKFLRDDFQRDLQRWHLFLSVEVRRL